MTPLTRPGLMACPPRRSPKSRDPVSPPVSVATSVSKDVLRDSPQSFFAESVGAQKLRLYWFDPAAARQTSFVIFRHLFDALSRASYVCLAARPRCASKTQSPSMRTTVVASAVAASLLGNVGAFEVSASARAPRASHLAVTIQAPLDGRAVPTRTARVAAPATMQVQESVESAAAREAAARENVGRPSRTISILYTTTVLLL